MPSRFVKMSHVSLVTGPPDEITWRNSKKKKTQKNSFLIDKIFEGLSIFLKVTGHKPTCWILILSGRSQVTHPLSIWIKWYSTRWLDLTRRKMNRKSAIVGERNRTEWIQTPNHHPQCAPPITQYITESLSRIHTSSDSWKAYHAQIHGTLFHHQPINHNDTCCPHVHAASPYAWALHLVRQVSSTAKRPYILW